MFCCHVEPGRSRPSTRSANMRSVIGGSRWSGCAVWPGRVGHVRVSMTTMRRFHAFMFGVDIAFSAFKHTEHMHTCLRMLTCECARRIQPLTALFHLSVHRGCSLSCTHSSSRPSASVQQSLDEHTTFVVFALVGPAQF